MKQESWLGSVSLTLYSEDSVSVAGVAVAASERMNAERGHDHAGDGLHLGPADVRSGRPLRPTRPHRPGEATQSP